MVSLGVASLFNGAKSRRPSSPSLRGQQGKCRTLAMNLVLGLGKALANALENLLVSESVRELFRQLRAHSHQLLPDSHGQIWSM